MGSRRTTELLLLAAAAPSVLLVFALTAAATGTPLTWAAFLAPTGLITAFAAAHVAARRFAPGADPALLPIALLLSGLGLAVITRLDAKLAGPQTLWILAGVGALALTISLLPPLERIARYKYTIMLVALVMLLLPAVIGREVNGAKLWLRIGSMSFQPAEIAKILIVVFLAAYLAEYREVLSVPARKVLGVHLPAARHLGPLLLMWVVSLVVLVAEKDLGSSLLFFGVFLVMITVATGRAAYALVGSALFCAGAATAYRLFAHVRTRVSIWLDPFADAADKGYQLVQSLFAFAAGGVIGTGIGRGMPTRIPFVATDFVFSAIGEELGLLGAAAVIIAYLVLCLRGLAIATRARSDVTALTAVGLVTALALQVFVIVGGVTRLIPLTGITLPFISYGGSSILANFVLLGLLMRAGDDEHGHGSGADDAQQVGVLGRGALMRRVTGTGWLVVALVTALVANLTWIQVVRARDLNNDVRNTRNLEKELRSERGAVLTRDGAVLARSVRQPDGTYRRTYPSGTLAAHLVGYYSSRYGRAGVEAAGDDVLSGHRGYATFSDVADDLLGRQVPGNDIVLTIDSRIQAAAERALAGRTGAVVAIDPRSGAVLALASAPAYRPDSVDADWSRLSGGPGAPLLNRAVASLYPPGSTFKVVTLTRVLSSGIATAGTVLPAPAVLEAGGGRVTNFEGADFGSATLAEATRSSINTVYARLAVEMGAPALVDQARAYGFDKPIPFELTVQPSLMSDPAAMHVWETAWAGAGQPVGDAAVKGPVATALEMALVASGVANKGVVMRPYLFARTTDPSGRTVSSARPEPWSTATDPATAEAVRALMVEAVEHGSGTRARISGVQVAGKTGTAEVAKGRTPHAWFVGFAPARSPSIAMAIVIENGGVGGRVAAPAARGVLVEGLAH